MKFAQLPVWLLAVTCFFSLGNVLRGEEGLSFEQTRIEMAVAPDAKTVTVPYVFSNRTERAITIKRYDSACSCLSAKIKGGKLVYKPGESGEIKVTFELGTFFGLVEKTVFIWTTGDPDEKPSTVLSVVLDIPVLFEVNPKTVFWQQNGEAKPQIIKLTVNNPAPIHILEHSVTNKNFRYRLNTIEQGRKYELVVEPLDVSIPALGMIKLTTDSSIPRYHKQMAFVCVRREGSVPLAR